MKFLITGVTGFAGPHLAKLLIDDGHEVVGTYREGSNRKDDPILDKVEWLYLSLESPHTVDNMFKQTKFDGVFHLGGFTHPPSSFETPRLALETNAVGTAAICNGIVKHQPDCIFMQCSTPEVYGICPGDRKIDETFPMNPMNPYGVAKAAADLYVLERVRNAKLKAFLTRAFSHTGPRRRPNYSISSDAIQIAKIIKGKQEPIIKVGNLKAQRVVADVRDIVTAYYQLMLSMNEGDFKPGEIFHIAGNDLHEIGYYLEIMLKLFKVEAKLEVDDKLYRPIDIPVQIPDDSKVKKLLGWEPKIKIEDTLKDLVEYWLEKV